MKFMLGADPELFMKDGNDAFMSAVGLIGGSKQHPQPLPIGDGFAVQEDNVAVEYNIPPSPSRDMFVANISRAMDYLSMMIRAQGLKFINVSATTEFPEIQLLTPGAMSFGCDPDFNAWDGGKRNPRPKADDHRLRTCGGHVHIGHKFDNKESTLDFIKYLDLFLSVPSVLQDKGELRKQLYGKAGAFRFKPYGVEYRSLSNYWVFDSDITGWVWDATERAMNAWQDGDIDIDLEADNILNAINNNNKPLAYSLVTKYQLLMA